MLMEKSGIDRILMGSGMFDSARSMMLASFPKDLSPQEIRNLLLARTYPELMTRNTDQQTKPITSSVSERLTRSEIDSLRLGKKLIADYAQKALKDKIAAALSAVKS